MNTWSAALLVLGGLWVLLTLGCDSGNIKQQGMDSQGYVPPSCAGGTDLDNDGYGPGCPAGPDCDDRDPATHPQALERCDGKDNDCDGEVDERLSNCLNVGGSGTSSSRQDAPFPLDQQTDPNFLESDDVGLDEDRDLTLNRAATLQVEFILQTEVKDVSPVLHDFGISYSCNPQID